MTKKNDKLKAARSRARKRRDIMYTRPEITPANYVTHRAILRKWDDEVLKTVSNPVDASHVTESEVVCCIKSMMVLVDRHDGIGLAANQAGYDKRIIVVDCADRRVTSLPDFMTMINPVVVDHSPEKVAGIEGCLSYPGEQRKITRYRWVDVEYLDEQGEKQKELFGERVGRIVQHELDHLEGVCQVGKLDLESLGVPKWLA